MTKTSLPGAHETSKMPRIRVTIQNTPDRAEQLRLADRARDLLIDRVPVRLDREHPLQGIHRDEQGQAYFEFATDDIGAVRQLLGQAGQFPFATVTEPQARHGEACANCGNVAGEVLPAVCPNCGFQDISPCPVCHRSNPRSLYERVSGKLFRCPTALDGVRHRVKLGFNEPLFNADGSYNQPLVVVQETLPR